jgi:hypothetical protein
MGRLFTNEDKFNFHKILGTYCLLHFGYRLFLLSIYGNMFFNYGYNYLSIIPHFILSISSLIFKISKSRVSNNAIIYEELRLHNIVFTTRSIVCFYLLYFNYHIVFRMIACILTNISADIVTYFYKKGSTIADIPFDGISSEKERKIRRSYSSAQLSATLFMLCDLEIIFLPLCAIQIAPFLMTLIKKGYGDKTTFHMVYSLMITINYLPLYDSTDLIVKLHILRKILEIVRFDYNVNKYIMWPITFFIFYKLQEYTITNIPLLNYFLIGYVFLRRLYNIYKMGK